MDWHELHKKKVTELREMAKEKTDLEGVSALTKEKLVSAVAAALGIPKPHKLVETTDKGRIKARIQAFKTKLTAAHEQGDQGQIRFARGQIRVLKRKLRRTAHVTR